MDWRDALNHYNQSCLATVSRKDHFNDTSTLVPVRTETESNFDISIAGSPFVRCVKFIFFKLFPERLGRLGLDNTENVCQFILLTF